MALIWCSVLCPGGATTTGTGSKRQLFFRCQNLLVSPLERAEQRVSKQGHLEYGLQSSVCSTGQTEVCVGLRANRKITQEQLKRVHLWPIPYSS